MSNLTSENYLHQAGNSTISWHAEPNHETRKGWVIVIDTVCVVGQFITRDRFKGQELFAFRESVRLGDKDCNDDHFDRLAVRYWKEFHQDEADDARLRAAKE